MWHLWNRLFSVTLLAILLGASCTTSKTPIVESTIYLVRHAEKADDGTRDPPLTEEGVDRANYLSGLLSQQNIQLIYSTDYKRTRGTATPLASATNQEVLIYNPRELSAFANELLDKSGQNILVAGHSNSTPTLANLILGEERFEKFDESDYNNLIIIKVRGDHKTAEMEEFDPN